MRGSAKHTKLLSCQLHFHSSPEMNSNSGLRNGYLSSACARSRFQHLRRGTRSAVLLLIGRLEARMRGSEKPIAINRSGRGDPPNFISPWLRGIVCGS
jgi:hypothetical protein